MKTQPINSIRQYIYTQKKTKTNLQYKTLSTRFNLGKKNYRPVFFKKTNLSLSLSSKLDTYNYLPYNTQYNYYNHLQQVYLQDTNIKKTLKYLPSVLVNFYTSSISNKQIVNNLPNVLPLVKSVTLNLTNPDMYYINSLIDYYLSFYVLSKYRIHSKKASIIIAQIIDSGHFSRRTVYLSNTQSTSLKYKAKLIEKLVYSLDKKTHELGNLCNLYSGGYFAKTIGNRAVQGDGQSKKFRELITEKRKTFNIEKT